MDNDLGNQDQDYYDEEEMQDSNLQEIVDITKDELADRLQDKLEEKVREKIKEKLGYDPMERFEKELWKRLKRVSGKNLPKEIAKKEAEEIAKRMAREATEKAGRDAVEKASQDAAKGTGKEATQKTAQKIAKPTTGGVSTAVETTATTTTATTTTATTTTATTTTATTTIAGVSVTAGLVILIIVVVIIILIVLVVLFTGAINGINSMSGGSVAVAANYANSRDRQIVSNLLDKMNGNNPNHELVVYDDGKGDIDWQCEINSTTEQEECFHLLDIRLLKTLDYITDLHERIEIGLLKTNAPDLLRSSFFNDIDIDTGEKNRANQETLSAFYTGQAMTIIAIDRSKIPELAANPPPVEVSWQKTISERVTRPLWEEIAFTAGILDDNIRIYENVIRDEHINNLDQIANNYQISLSDSDSRNFHKLAFEKIARIVTLIYERALVADSLVGMSPGGVMNIMDSRTLGYLEQGGNYFKTLHDNINNPNISSIDKIKFLGENTDLIREGARYIYKATQVANMVNWNKNRLDGNLEWKKAYEARNKIRQVIKELLEMPREVSLSGEPELFDQSLVVKQIITFSPEDDLDNGLSGLDIFPNGVTSVDIGGVGMSLLNQEIDSESGNIVMVGDGVCGYEDTHFSHAPIDNGIFSKAGVNYIYRKVTPESSWFEKAWHFSFKTPFSSPLSAGIFVRDKVHDYFVGGCDATADLTDSDYWFNIEECRKVSYKDYLFVAF